MTRQSSNTTHTGTFEPLELARLSIYRAAVQAGFFTDWSSREGSSDRMFTGTELARLVIYRAAVRAGFYDDGERR